MMNPYQATCAQCLWCAVLQAHHLVELQQVVPFADIAIQVTC
jgi:hypothetical protein